MKRAPLLLASTLALAVAGCPDTNVIDDDALDANEDAFGPPVDAAPDDAPVVPADAGPTDAFTRNDAGPVPIPRDVDLLFVVDNSGSMAEEQVNLILELPRLVQVLATGDLDGDGVEDFAPPESLHVGFVSTDMGAGPIVTVPTCRAGLGDDGILRARSRVTTAPCMATYPSGVFEFARTDDAAAFAGTLGCVANLGTGGCGFEQQLEAGLKAVTPSAARPWTAPGYEPPRFADVLGTPDVLPGHAEGANAGFLRPDSLFGVVFVTDEEDCSVIDYGLFETGNPRYAGVPLNLRCNTFGDRAMGVLQPVQRYVEGLLGLRRSPANLVFAGIVGIPPETEGAAAAGDFATVLSNPNMIPRPNAMGTNLEPSCSTVNGVAYPPIRFVQVAAGLQAAGANVTVSSICTNDFGPAIDGLVARLAGRS